ncbi:NTP pyrophosphohydrolase [Streptomyces sp. OZ13]|uniref:NTP pyrophosphohydrolase n=1 Tax=Streptomyces sp. OZ13 TaxID=3452210 RepID=UPI003F8C026A
MDTLPVLLVVDGANVVGSGLGPAHAEGCGGGWWRDRRGAAERLRDRLVAYAPAGIAGLPGPVEIVLVVEGAARGLGSVPGVRVEPAAGSGDDLIVETVAAAAGRLCVVVTADRELRRRVEAHGARCVGPRAVRPAAPDRSQG